MNFKIKKRKAPTSKLGKFFDSNLYIFLAFLCSAVLMLLIYYCFDVIPFGQTTVLRMDLYHQYGPLFAELYDRLTDFKSLVYSWNTGGGGSFIGNYYNYLSSPIGIIIALIAGHENIPEAIGTMVLVKNALAAAAMAYFLKKSFKKSDFTLVAFGIMYAFCGFFIAYYWNVMWIDAMYLLPLVALGIQKIINERNCKLYIATLAISFFSNYYMAYMLCFFAVFYFLVYYISNNAFKEHYSDIPIYEDDDGTLYSRGIHKFLYNKFLRSGFFFAVSSVVAVCLVAFAIIPTYFCLKACSATSGSFPDSLSYYNNVFDFLANHFASLEPTIRSSGDTVLPNVYCGIMTIILVPLYIFCNKISMKERVTHIVFLAIFFIGFNTNYANYILHAMHFPNDLPFRFSFLYSFLLLIMAYKALVNIRSISGKAIIGAGLGVISFAVIVQKVGMANVNDTTIYISIGFVVAYTIILGLLKKKEYAQSAVALLLMCCVFAEAAVSDTDHFQINQIKGNFTNSYSDFRALKNSLDTSEGNDDYRLEVTNINTLMDASWFDYNGISVFSSMAYEASANLQNQLGLDSNYINSYIYPSQTPVYNAMMSLKYLVNNDSSMINKELYSFAAACGKFTAYKNKYYLPIAYCVGKEVTNLDTASTNPFEIQSMFWQYATGLEGVFNTLTTSNYELNNIVESGEDFASESFSFYKANKDADGAINLYYVVPENENVYLYLKCSDIDSINVSADNGFIKNQSIEEPYILDCGYCYEGDTISVEIPVDGETETGYVECHAAGLNMDVFESGYNYLNKFTMEVETFDETNIKGTVTAEDGQMLYTSVNYDDGWTVKVDGVVTNKVKIGGALIGVYLSAGEHKIEMSYHAKGLTIGIAISSATALLVILYLIYMNIIRKKISNKKNGKAKPISDDSKGIDAMMDEDLGKNASIDDAELLIHSELLTDADNVDPIMNKQIADELMKNTQIESKHSNDNPPTNSTEQ